MSLSAVADQAMEAQRTLRRWLASVSIFAFFYYLLALLTFKADSLLGVNYSQYTPIFVTNFWLLTAASIIYVFMAVLPGGTSPRIIRETAIAVSAWDAIGAVLAIFGMFLIVYGIYYVAGMSFPWSLDQILYFTPILTIAAITETFVWQWFLARAFDTRWKYGFFYAQIAFALAHPNLTPGAFIALLMLGLLFYYATNPAKNLPFFMNLVFAAGIHTFYNVFVFAYESRPAFLAPQFFGGMATEAWLFYALLAAILVLVVVGERRSRLGRYV